MIDPILEKMFFEDLNDLVIAADDVAVLREDANLYHAAIILSNSFSTIPVLSSDDEVLARLSLADILNASIDDGLYNMQKLYDLDVKDILDPEHNEKQRLVSIPVGAPLEDILGALNNSNFTAVVDGNGKFLGIITRRAVMSRINRIFHTIDKRYMIIPKLSSNDNLNDYLTEKGIEILKEED